MPARRTPRPDRRRRLLKDIERLARMAIFGTASESYRCCGNPGCRCHGAGPKHGPHLYVSYRGEAGRTTGYYIPQAAHEDIRQGIEAWQRLQQCLREVAGLNAERALTRAREARSS
jgi:hypothetical protein